MAKNDTTKVQPIALADLDGKTMEELIKIADDLKLNTNGFEADQIKAAIVEATKPADPQTGSNPPADPPKTSKDGVKVVSPERSGKSTTAVTGEVITFDKDGVAYVDPQDAEYLKTIPGFEVK